MILTAWSEGIASNWSGFMKLSAIKPILEIPDTLDVLAVIPFRLSSKSSPGKEKAQATRWKLPIENVLLSRLSLRRRCLHDRTALRRPDSESCIVTSQSGKRYILHTS